MRSGNGLVSSDLLRLFGLKLAAELHVGFPARVVRVDRAIVDVQPEVDRNIEAIDGSRVIDALPVIPSVPVLYPRALGYAITWPLTTDDTLFVVCADRNLGEWMRARATNPGDLRTHTLDGAVALAGLYSNDNALEEVPDCLSLRSLAADGCAIEIRDGEIRIGRPDASKKAVHEDVDDHLDAISKDLDVIAAAAGATAANYGAGGRAALVLAKPFKASKVKVT